MTQQMAETNARVIVARKNDESRAHAILWYTEDWKKGLG